MAIGRPHYPTLLVLLVVVILAYALMHLSKRGRRGAPAGAAAAY